MHGSALALDWSLSIVFHEAELTIVNAGSDSICIYKMDACLHISSMNGCLKQGWQQC